ncbi:hypothetical protein [Archangium primigenium]|uniref:hypothetical protein n=1 Tax=[Archangium] primigenium TaxID=2792470 RepID=UPI00195CC3B9|nr:hypothetical protein [Archangium primigenium]MBM7118671.1 hypothetical protein [Archangium primigenium]
MRVVLLGLMGVLAACGGRQGPRPDEVIPSAHRVASDAVLVWSVDPEGQAAQSWQPAALWRRELSAARARVPRRTSPVVLVSSRPRDCDQEQLDCHRDCMSRKPPYPHGARLNHGHVNYCDTKCLNAYMDCLKAQQAAPLRLHEGATSATWFQNHQDALTVGGIVIVAGVACVVISVGVGVWVLAPLALL